MPLPWHSPRRRTRLWWLPAPRCCGCELWSRCTGPGIPPASSSTSARHGRDVWWYELAWIGRRPAGPAPKGSTPLPTNPWLITLGLFRSLPTVENLFIVTLEFQPIKRMTVTELGKIFYYMFFAARYSYIWSLLNHQNIFHMKKTYSKGFL